MPRLVFLSFNAANNGVETAEKFLADPWVQYRLGNFSVRGWLAEHSAAYRYFLAYRNWMAWDFAGNHSLVLRRTGALTPDGYDIENRVAEDPYRPPDPNDPEDAEAFEVFDLVEEVGRSSGRDRARPAVAPLVVEHHRPLLG